MAINKLRKNPFIVNDDEQRRFLPVQEQTEINESVSRNQRAARDAEALRSRSIEAIDAALTNVLPSGSFSCRWSKRAR